MKENISRLIGNSVLQVKKHSPEILTIGGIIGMVGTVVIACKKTLKINDILDEKKKNVEAIHGLLEENNPEKYSQKDANKDLTIVYTQTGVKLIKLYAPAIGLGILSIGSITLGHNILNKRNAAIAAAYTLVNTSFKNYRNNVIERFGKTVDDELRFNIKSKEIKEKENGKIVKKSIQEIEVDDMHKEFSDYARFFDASCQGHTKDPEYNLMYLRQQQAYCNEILKSRGHLFLNEVYDILDIPRTKAGQVVGWIYKKDGNNPNGDNYVDFGIYDQNYEPSRRFVNGCEYNILLDFNVDGVIYDLI